MTPSVGITVRMPPDIADAIRAAAENDMMSVQTLIRLAIVKYMDERVPVKRKWK